MSKLESAYRVLEVEPGAGFKQISEAREDLLTLWDPDRLARYPRLKARSASKIAEINQAYELLMEHAGRLPSTGKALDARSQLEVSSNESSNAKPSLYDEVFSRSGAGTRGKLGWWIGGGLILLAGIVTWAQLSTATLPAPAGDSEIHGPAPAEAIEESPLLVDDPGEPATPPPPQEPDESPGNTRPVHRPDPPSQPAATTESTPPPVRRPAADPPTGKRPVLERDLVSDRPAEKQAEKVAAQRDAEAEQALAWLLSASIAASGLVDGAVEGFQVIKWELLKKEGDEFWIDIQADDRGNTVHFVWAVKDESTFRALSTAARQLEQSVRPRN